MDRCRIVLALAAVVTLVLVVLNGAQASEKCSDDQERFLVIEIDGLPWDLAHVDSTVAARVQAGYSLDHDLELERIVLSTDADAITLRHVKRLSSAARNVEFSLFKNTSTPPRRAQLNFLDHVYPLIVIRTSVQSEIHGWAEFRYYPTESNDSSLHRVPFRIPAKIHSENGELVYWIAQCHEWAHLTGNQEVGGEWWLLQLMRLERKLGFKVTKSQIQAGADDTPIRSSFDLLSGGRAVQENLQLDRALTQIDRGAAANEVLPLDCDLTELVGITRPEYDWQPLLTEPTMPAETLARFIPHDQHAIFFPSQADFQRFMNDLSELGLPLLQTSQVMGEVHDWPQKYFLQMQIPVPQISQWPGIKAMAVTGGDPYFDLGTDIAVLFEGDVGIVAQELEKLTRASSPATTGVTAGRVVYRGQTIRFSHTADRSSCCYWTKFSDVLIVANSLGLIQRTVDVQRRDTRSLADLDEYRFFRQRYPHSKNSETAFLLISDATIRRWCSPQWRIGQHRRIQAFRVLQLVDLLQGTPGYSAEGDQQIFDQLLGMVPNLDSISIRDGRGFSDPYGDARFLTPISELPFGLGNVTEQQGYLTWRQNYERAWSQAFDPIGLSLHLTDKTLMGDLTVMPLISWTSYRWLRGAVGGTVLPAQPGFDARHDFELIMALNATDSFILPFLFAQLAKRQLPPLTWLGNRSSAWIMEPEELVQEVWEHDDWLPWVSEFIPVVMALEIRDETTASAYLATIGESVFDEPTGFPWKNAKAAGVQVRKANFLDWPVYLASGNPLLLSLNPSVLDEAIRIRSLMKEPPELVTPSRFSDQLGLGEHVRVRVTARGYQVMAARANNPLVEPNIATSTVAWKNLPILNEWYRLFPHRDPREVHRSLFGVDLIAPDGTGYKWNEEDRTIESQSYGHPTRPKTGPLLPPALDRIEVSQFGITFEDDGIRARSQLDWRTDR